MYAKFHHNIPLSSRDRAIFTFLEFGARQNLDRWKNDISQSLGLDLDNIKVYAEVYQNIQLSSRDKAIFTFSEFEPRQRLGQSQMTFDNLLGYILSISMRMQNLSKYSKRFKSCRHFSTFFTNRSASKSSQTVRWQNNMFDYGALYEIQLQVSVDFLRVVQWPTQENRLLSNLYQSQTIYHSSRTEEKEIIVPLPFDIWSLWHEKGRRSLLVLSFPLTSSVD